MAIASRNQCAAVLAMLAGLSLALYAQPGRWRLLGTAHVDGKADHDNIRVGMRDGKFRAIQLRVKGGAIEFNRVVVHYGNGEPEEVRVREHIRAGGATRAIDLRGFERFIQRVEIWYERGGWARRPEVQLYGLP